MEVRSEQPFSIGMQKSAVTAKPSIPGMRLTMTHDGTAVYKPTQAISSVLLDPPFHGGNSNGNSAAPAALNMASSDLAKKKRGRPRKYAQDGSMALALAPVSAISGAQQDRGGFSSLSMGQENVDPFVPGCLPMKKARGRPSGSGKKLQLLALGAAGTGFTPHVITVNAGEDVSSKILSFSQHGPRAICILSANGAISNVTLRQANTSGGTVTYEGRFEILSLSGSFLLSENGGQRSRTGGLSVSLSGPDGRVVGGGVAGLLTAASPVQVVVASFISDKKEKKQNHPMDGAPVMERLASADIIPGNGGLITGDGSPPSRGALSGSSGGPASPLNQSMSTFNNNNQHGFSGVLWK